MERTEFGGLLRGARERARLTLEGLAAASGVSVRAIGDMERGRSVPRLSTLAELLDALPLDEQERRTLTEAARTARTTRTGATAPAAAATGTAGATGTTGAAGTAGAAGTKGVAGEEGATGAADARDAGEPTPLPVPRQLPPDLRSFRGRAEPLARLAAAALTADGHPPLVAVSGLAGVGKTSLAVHWAHRHADRFPDGLLYLNLRGFDPSGDHLDPAEALSGLLGALGVPAAEVPEGVERRSAAFRERIAGRRMLLLLDNARDSQQLRPLLPRSATCLTVITSRHHLTGLAATDDAVLVDLAPWNGEEGLAALAARIGTGRVAAEPAPAAELVELCGRLPLAVAILAARLGAEPALGLRAVAGELTRARTRLDEFTTDDPHTDVRAVFSWSYRALDPEAARFFRHLAVLPGPSFSTEAAASASAEPPSRARRLLRSLISTSLLGRDAAGQFVLHDLVREHAAELLHQEGDDRYAAELRLLDYLRHNARASVRAWETRTIHELDHTPAPGVVLLPFDDREGALAWFRQEERTILAALRRNDDPRLLHFRSSLAQDCVPYFSALGQWADEIEIQQLALDAALLLDDPVAISQAAAALGRALSEAGRSEEADLALGHIERHLCQLAPFERANALRSLGWVRGRQQRHAEALDHARAALAIYRTLDDPNPVARELNAVGWYSTLLGRHREAIASCREALPLLQRTGNTFSEAATWDSIGYALHRLGELPEAVRHFEVSLRLYGEVLNHYNQAEVLDHLARAQHDLGDSAAARASWLRAAELLTALGNPRAGAMRAAADRIAGEPTGA
ncbi:ATP-binding protein [Kitasatospora sp. NPDC051853]|uniref:ATP-binding protein n=1 Tax=Kitasatospora sp. NPDC051853 TaxID=3364058 RepID=UPI0037B20C6A